MKEEHYSLLTETITHYTHTHTLATFLKGGGTKVSLILPPRGGATKTRRCSPRADGVRLDLTQGVAVSNIVKEANIDDRDLLLFSFRNSS